MLASEYRKRTPSQPTNVDTGKSALRVLRVLRDLQRRWCRVAGLADQHGVDDKTVRRDLATIRKAGFRVRVRVEKYNRKAYRAS